MFLFFFLDRIGGGVGGGGRLIFVQTRAMYNARCKQCTTSSDPISEETRRKRRGEEDVMGSVGGSYGHGW